MRYLLKQFMWCALASTALLPATVLADHIAGHVGTTPPPAGPSVFDCAGNGLEGGYYFVIEDTYVPTWR